MQANTVKNSVHILQNADKDPDAEIEGDTHDKKGCIILGKGKLRSMAANCWCTRSTFLLLTEEVDAGLS
jgi:hypothetical protein